jgi:hypothetical protein
MLTLTSKHVGKERKKEERRRDETNVDIEIGIELSNRQSPVMM